MVVRPKKMDLMSGNCQDGNIDDDVVVVVNDRNVADDSVVDAYRDANSGDVDEDEVTGGLRRALR